MAIFSFFFAVFLVKKRPKKAEIQKVFFCSIFFVGEHLHSKFQKISSNGLDFGKKSFWLFFGCFLIEKRPKKAEIQKKFFYSIFFVGKHLHTKFQKTSSNGLDFGNFIFFAVFCCFLVKKRPKKAEIQKKFFCSIFFVGKHLHTKYQKILSNGLDLAFVYFFCCFLVKKKQPKKDEN